MFAIFNQFWTFESLQNYYFEFTIHTQFQHVAEHQRHSSTPPELPFCRDDADQHVVDDDEHGLLQQRRQHGPVPSPFASDSSREEGEKQQQGESNAEANADFSNEETPKKNCAEIEEEKIENQNANADDNGTAEEKEEGGFFVGTGKLLLANLLRHNYKELPLLLLNNLSTHQGRAQMLGTVRRAWMARLNRTIERTAGVLSAATKLVGLLIWHLCHLNTNALFC